MREIIADRIYYLDGKRDEPVIHLQLFLPHQLETDYPRCRLQARG